MKYISGYIDDDVCIEFESICQDIGCDKIVMLNEVLREFNKDMRKAQKHKLKTIYGDIFSTDGK